MMMMVQMLYDESITINHQLFVCKQKLIVFVSFTHGPPESPPQRGGGTRVSLLAVRSRERGLQMETGPSGTRTQSGTLCSLTFDCLFQLKAEHETETALINRAIQSRSKFNFKVTK